MAVMLAMPARWTCRPYSVAAAERLSAALGVSPTLAAILARRGYESIEDARRFMAADECHDPWRLFDMRTACSTILGHVERGSRILVHGDYDVDGVCSTAVLIRTLRALGAAPAWHLPSRFDGGYGLSRETVAWVVDAGTGLLLTADCGITCLAEIEEATARGMDVVVTDHHRPSERLPGCPTVH
ncbi:MAG: DHH family phosphoesterase, partial [Actinomycetota bacterium]|nr:DHH family phosphoesterase [Actinomycetota bacterium]